MGREIPRRIKEDLSKRIRRAHKVLFFLDYDGTLVPVRKKPSLAGITKGVKVLLENISRRKWARVFIISGRALKDIKQLIGIKSISYSGNHGIEFEGPDFKYVHPAAKAAGPYIQRCYRILKKRLKIKGLIFENKFYTLSIHYRCLPARKIPVLNSTFKQVVRGFDRASIKITHGKKVFEIRPNINWHKGKILKSILRRIRTRFTLPIYIGDDITDEDAFRTLGKRGISILVSKRKKKTKAQYRLNSPKEVIGFLKFVLELMATNDGKMD